MSTTAEQKKVCTGPAHPGPVALPLDDNNWYFHKQGKRKGLPLSRCKLCVNWSRLQSANGQSGTVDCKKVLKYVEELVLRYGTAEVAARATGVSASTLRSVLGEEQCTLQKRTALKIISALDNKRREDRRNGTVSKSFRAALKARALSQERMERRADYY